MANYQNHLVDPTFFYDAIEEFAFDYDIYVVVGKEIDDYGTTKRVYEKQVIRGSLQSQGLKHDLQLTGNKNSMDYEFYCKSLYRINIGDIIEYKGNYFRVNSVNDYDEFGVRSCTLGLIMLTAYKDLRDYIAYLEGEKIV